MGAYEAFASIYDEYMEDVPYGLWLSRIRERLEAEGVTEGLVLELGCGTGTFTRMLAECGYDMIGLDHSEDMLMRAQEKEAEDPRGILYLEQEMEEMELYGTVRAVVSVCDSMNYLPDTETLTEVIRKANNYLDPGGLFLFDMRTRHHYADVIGDRTIAESSEDSAFIWENRYDPEEKINVFALTLFTEREDGAYERSEELHVQRAFSAEEVLSAAAAGGMKAEEVIDMDSGKEPGPETERLLFVLREQGKEEVK